MSKYAIKKPSNEPGVWEWYSIKDDNSSYVELRFFDFRDDAVNAAKNWAPNAEVVELNK